MSTLATPTTFKTPASSLSFLSYSALQHIPEARRIEIVHLDLSIVVIAKPGHLRSVPGHARNNDMVHSQQPIGKRKRDDDAATGNTPSGQRAWIAAIQSFKAEDQADGTKSTIQKYVTRLAENAALVASAPRKLKTFCRYLYRNKQRIFDNEEDYSEEIATEIFELLQQKLRTFLPEPTKPEDSALGQLKLLGIHRTDQAIKSSQQDLYIVHRLDCETSGVMVFARTQSAASALAKVWRQRDAIHKTYVAHVCRWPPFHDNGIQRGSIDLPLKPSDERLKWQVCLVSADGAKPSQTRWRVLLEPASKNEPVVLELSPITGRTHQLRIHCAAVGSGITGDTLYTGKDSLAVSTPLDSSFGLRLHAHKLTIPHPDTDVITEFAAKPPGWMSNMSSPGLPTSSTQETIS